MKRTVNTIELLREYAAAVLAESPASDAFEQRVAKDINSVAKNIKATRPAANTALPDVLVTIKEFGTSFIEVKMNHTDNLANPRVFYDGSAWRTSYATPVAKFAVDVLNSSEQAKKFITDLSKFTNLTNPKLSTTKSQLKQENMVSLQQMLEFVTNRGNRYIVDVPNVNIGKLVTDHYTQGKAAAAHYLQSGDDFYMIGTADPFGLNDANGNKIPILGGDGNFKVRVSTRSQFYEIQVEVKIKKFQPAHSEFSVLKSSNKINPFVAIVPAEKVVSPTIDQRKMSKVLPKRTKYMSTKKSSGIKRSVRRK